MSGFDNAKVDDEFFAAGQCEECEQQSSRKVTLNQIFYATSVMVTVQNSFHGIRGWNSPRHARYCECLEWAQIPTAQAIAGPPEGSPR